MLIIQKVARCTRSTCAHRMTVDVVLFVDWPDVACPKCDALMRYIHVPRAAAG